MIGHVILQKSFDGEDLLKVTGGRLLANGNRGAVVDAVKCGSIADLEGQILPGEYHKISTWIHSSLAEYLSELTESFLLCSSFLLMCCNRSDAPFELITTTINYRFHLNFDPIFKTMSIGVSLIVPLMFG